MTATEVCFVISPSLVPSLENTRQSSVSPRSSTELSDEMNGKTHYRLSWPMMKRCRAGRDENEEEQKEEDEEKK